MRPFIADSAQALSTISGMKDLVRKYAPAAVVLDDLGRRDCAKVAEVLKHHMKASAKELVVSASGRPMLLSFSADGTPVHTKEH